MTVVASWLSKEIFDTPYIFTVADTKISSGNETLTLEGSKVLELPIRCKDISTPAHRIYFESFIGYSFAGSSLIGLNVYCTLQTIFSNLGGLQQYNSVPDYMSICQKTKEILSIYVQSIQSVAEVMIFGFCPKSKIPFICKISPEKGVSPIQYVMNIADTFGEQMHVNILGNHKAEIIAAIKSRQEAHNNRSLAYWRTPAKVLKDIVEQGKYETIGGNLQVAIVSQTNFDLYALVVPIKGEEPKATMMFRNLDVFDDIGSMVGECTVSIKGIVF